MGEGEEGRGKEQEREREGRVERTIVDVRMCGPNSRIAIQTGGELFFCLGSKIVFQTTELAHNTSRFDSADVSSTEATRRLFGSDPEKTPDSALIPPADERKGGVEA